MNADGFADAIAAAEHIIARERGDAAIEAAGVSLLLHHGARTERSIVLYHGFTNAPRQFEELGRLFFSRGYNVFVPRLPRHGLADRMTDALAGLTTDELKMCALQSAQIVRQLGVRSCALGLSVGGTMAAWLAQTQPLDIAVALAPFISVAHVPDALEPALAGTLLLAPDMYLWWDPRNRENVGPAHAYPRFPMHALANALMLGESVRALARTAAPRSTRIVMAINDRDPAIDNGAALALLEAWQAQGAVAGAYHFRDLDARHDIIEPTTYADAARLVYPVLLDLCDVTPR